MRTEPTRRAFLVASGLGLAGLGSGRVQAAPSTGKAKSTILFFLCGGASHLDTWDMKLDAPAEYRGEFKPIKTNVPGIDICELMPGLARHADKYTIIRSVTTMNKPGDHGRAPYYWLTGNPRLPSGTDEFPMYGSAVSKFRPGPAGLPTFATLE